MPSLASPTQSMDTIYPEPMSRLHRRVMPKKRRGGSLRYRTQPVTFSEIQEVDEDNIDDTSSVTPSDETSKSEVNLLNQRFEEFRKSRDLLFHKLALENDEDLNKNVRPTHSKALGRLPSRPSF